MFTTIRHKWRLHKNRLSLFGWRVFLKQSGLSLLRRVFIFRIAVVYCIDTTDINIQLPETGKLKFKFVELDKIDEELISQSGITLDSLKLRLMKGNRCFIGTMNDTQCYFSIVSYNDFTITQRFSVSFSSEEAYVGNCYTIISHRGLGIYPIGLQTLAKKLAVEGKRWLYLYVEFENEASIRGVEKAGFYPVAKSSVWGLGSILRRKWCFLPIKRNQYNNRIKQWSVKVVK